MAIEGFLSVCLGLFLSSAIIQHFTQWVSKQPITFFFEWKSASHAHNYRTLLAATAEAIALEKRHPRWHLL